jgi:hypothetical protein
MQTAGRVSPHSFDVQPRARGIGELTGLGIKINTYPIRLPW